MMNITSMKKSAIACAVAVALAIPVGVCAAASKMDPLAGAADKGAYPPGGTAPAPSGEPKSKQSDKSSSSSLSTSDRNFINKAAAGGLAEVEIGKLAQEKAESQQAKELAAKLVQDHSKADQQLKQIAATRGIDVPDKLDKSAEREIDKLKKLSGAKFDHEFASHEVSDHKKDIKDFGKEAKSSKDEDLKSFASGAMPTLQEHLKLAQAAQGGNKTASRK